MSVLTPHAHRARRVAYGAVAGRSSRVPRPGAAASRTAVRVGTVVAAVLGYFGVRGLTDSSQAEAMHNAAWIETAERTLHLDWEPRLQSLVIGHPAITRLLNWIYIFGHWPVIALTLIWLLSRHQQLYTRAAYAMLLSGAVGLVAFAAFPVAPPRLAVLGLTDTVTQQSHAYRVLQPPAFTNQFAAMPSLHVGWNLLMTMAVLAATRNVFLRIVAVALTMSMDATVILTANHYVLDAIAGAALAKLGWYAAGQLQARSRPWAARNSLRRPSPVAAVMAGYRG